MNAFERCVLTHTHVPSPLPLTSCRPQPVANALFANSPFKEGKPSGHLSLRGHVWTDVDNKRTGGLPFVFEDNMSFER
jgi:gamma-glutamylcysteine synthetase